ncbi:MAG TPA: endonuclease [Bacteroidales bacterium]|nr:endonuclease [Bacteroidales bacterium]
MERLRTVSLLILLTLMPGLRAQAPPGYYNATTGLYGTALKAALHQIIDGHTPMAYNQLFACYASTDDRPDGTVWDMYSDVPGGTPPYIYHFIASDQCGNYSQEGDCFNREHSFPKSWFGGDVMPMYSDLFHLYPTDGFVNGQRGNLPYGETNNPDWTSLNGSRRGPSAVPGYSGTVFEPIDAYKGDLARTYFYMAVRYYSEDASWPGSPMTNGAEPLSWALPMLIQWHQSDTVSLKERERNDAVYTFQGNRNPFIDDPYFAERIWVTSAGLAKGLPELPGWWVGNEGGNLGLVLFTDIPLKANARLSLLDLCGRQLWQGKMDQGTISYTLPSWRFPSGSYILTVECPDNRPASIKIMIIN